MHKAAVDSLASNVARPRIRNGLTVLCFGSIVWLQVLARDCVCQSQTRVEAAATKWLTFPDCPVLLENSIEVPAQETGMLENIDVELNATVTSGQTLARLDDELATMELKIAKLQHAAAEELARDDSQVRFRKLTLKATEEELASHNSISKSVAGSELRRLNLSVGSASVEVQTAERAMKRAAVQAELAAATVQAAAIRLNQRRISAPLDGIVTAIHLRPGQWVEAGKPVLVVSNMQQLLVDCLIPVEKVDLKRIVGLEVRVESERVPASGKPVRLAGKITSYDPQVSSQGLVRVHSRIQNAREGDHWLLLPGMNVRLEVAVPVNSPALISRQPDARKLGK